MTIDPVTTELATFLANARLTELPQEVSDRGKIHLLDTLASIISGSAMPAGQRSRAWSTFAFGAQSGPCAVLGSALHTSPFVAATCNGMAAHADETDDSHGPSLSHPGCSVLPAALAVAQQMHRSGTDLLRAYVAGYDVGCRVGRAAKSYERSGRDVGRWSSHSVVGTFAAAAAAAVSYGLDEEQCRYLFSYTSQLASGTTTWMRDTHHVEKAFVFAGMPAGNGVLASSLVASGCDGVEDVFFGAPNWFDTAHPDPDIAALSDGLGVRFEVMDASVKKWAVGSPSQAAVDAMVSLIDDDQLKANDVEAIYVHLDPKGATVVDNRSMPNVNIQFLLAGTLIDGRFSMAMSHDEERMKDPEVRALMAKIQLVRDETFSGVRSATVKVETTPSSGRTTIERTVLNVRGSPKDPMSFSEVAKKASDLIGEVLGADKAQRVCDAVFSLEKCEAVDDLVGLCS